ncbi:hypothetical protein DMUE_0125 [Dictyocoela muelleri]|nr:hypothetical protein DMUE_0125 [Dictyocoela muelleri]
MYLLMFESSYKQLGWWYGISYTTINRFTGELRRFYVSYRNDRPIILGGPGYIVEVDETVCSRRGIIKNHTTQSDEVRDTVKIVGAIDNTPGINLSSNVYRTEV